MFNHPPIRLDYNNQKTKFAVSKTTKPQKKSPSINMLCSFRSHKALSLLTASLLSTTVFVSAWAQTPQRVMLHCSGDRNSEAIPTYAYTCESVDIIPAFPGGDGALMQFINTERKYPRQAYDDAIEGRVLCSFVVESDGSLTHLTVLRGVEESLNAEAIRIISKMPVWVPGQIDNKKVAVYCILPIPFRR